MSCSAVATKLRKMRHGPPLHGSHTSPGLSASRPLVQRSVVDCSQTLRAAVPYGVRGIHTVSVLVSGRNGSAEHTALDSDGPYNDQPDNDG